MKRTPFHDKHTSLGAKMVEFAGFEMPIQYPKGIMAEHRAVREGAGGVFDVSHMGEFDVKGPDALKLLNHLTVNDVEALIPGRAQYSCMPQPDGGIIDDLIIYMLDVHHYMVVVNAGTRQKDWDWIKKHSENYEVTLRDDSDKTALLAIQGKNAIEIVQKLTTVDLSKIEYYHFAQGQVAGVDMIISRTGYTGEPGLEIYFEAGENVAGFVWDKLFEAGASFGLEPVGLGARDTLRLEMGYCLYGNDIDETTNPIEAGLGWITKLNKRMPCLAVERLMHIRDQGPSRKLVGFMIEERGAIARHGHKVFDDADYHIGDVTSGNISPMLNKSIGLTFVPTRLSKTGSEILIEVRPGKKVRAVVTKPPFIKPEVKG